MYPVFIFCLSASVFLFFSQWYHGCSKGCCDYTGSIRCCHLQYRSSWWSQYVCQGWLYRLLYFLPSIGPRVRTCCSRSVCIHRWIPWLLSGIVLGTKKIYYDFICGVIPNGVLSGYFFRAILLNFWMISLNWSLQFSAPFLVYSTVFTTEFCLVLRLKEAWPPRCSSWPMRLRRLTSRPLLSTGCGIVSSSAPYVSYMDWKYYWNVFPNVIYYFQIRQRLGGRIRFILSGSAPVSPDVMDFMRICFSADVYEGYGQTENFCGSCLVRIDAYTLLKSVSWSTYSTFDRLLARTTPPVLSVFPSLALKLSSLTSLTWSIPLRINPSLVEKWVIEDNSKKKTILQSGLRHTDTITFLDLYSRQLCHERVLQESWKDGRDPWWRRLVAHWRYRSFRWVWSSCYYRSSEEHL